MSSISHGSSTLTRTRRYIKMDRHRMSRCHTTTGSATAEQNRVWPVDVVTSGFVKVSDRCALLVRILIGLQVSESSVSSTTQNAVLFDHRFDVSASDCHILRTNRLPSVKFDVSDDLFALF
ncbi:hypothetical protein NXS19_003975 [Fusarium pseudograminearum]|nr:hypothetical protein NXS19_003975 [Fusarium pseudograminearum]